MDPRHLRVLVELADRGTLRAVAAATGYGTSAVSAQLAALEKTVGVRLVEPDGRTLRLTPAGRAFLPYARRILVAVNAARTALDSGDVSGTIRVAAYGTALEADVVAVAVGLRDSHPALRVELYEREPPETLRLLRAGRVELGLVYDYSLVPRRPPPMISTEVLCEVPIMLVLPRDAPGPACVEEPADLQRLGDARWIVNSRASDDEELIRRMAALAGFEPDVTHGVDSLDVVQRLVAAGLGVALVPALIRPHPRTRLVPVTLAAPTRRMIAATRSGEESWPPTELVRRLIAEHARAGLERTAR
jgi:DNA-binding transcriptional LysR family regulator